MADLEEIMAGRDATPEIPSSEPTRDDGGRFAEGERQPEPAPQPQAPTETDAPERQQMVPHQALHAAREEAKGYRDKFGTLETRFNDLERQNQQLVQMLRQPQQPAQTPTPQEKPDWYVDPDAAFAHNIGQAISPLQQRLDAQREGFSQMLAVEKFGADTVQAAQSDLKRRIDANPQGMRHIYEGIMASPHPYGALVNWHNEQSALSQYGSDPKAFIESEIQRRLAEMGHQPAPQTQAAPQPQAAAPPPQMPSSFATARNGGPRSTPQASGPRALSEIMGR